MTEGEQQPVVVKTPSTARVRDWPRMWLHDEKFWKDVATRTIAGSMVVFLGYLVALASGLIAHPASGRVWSAIAWAVLVFVIYFGLTGVAVKIIVRLEEPSSRTSKVLSVSYWTMRVLVVPLGALTFFAPIIAFILAIHA